MLITGGANPGLSVQAGGVTLTTGDMNIVNGGSNGMTLTGNLQVTAGSVSITSDSSTTARVFDVFTSSTSFTGNALQGRVNAGVFGADMLVASNADEGGALFSVKSNGFVSVSGTNGGLLRVGDDTTAAGGMHVAAGLIAAGGVTVTTGQVIMAAGSISITSPSTAVGLDVSSPASFTGNLIEARLAASSTGNAMSLFRDMTLLWKVRNLCFFCHAELPMS
jgi:hypothetical protein